jgi:hypothetical protein
MIPNSNSNCTQINRYIDSQYQTRFFFIRPPPRSIYLNPCHYRQGIEWGHWGERFQLHKKERKYCAKRKQGKPINVAYILHVFSITTSCNKLSCCNLWFHQILKSNLSLLKSIKLNRHMIFHFSIKLNVPLLYPISSLLFCLFPSLFYSTSCCLSVLWPHNRPDSLGSSIKFKFMFLLCYIFLQAELDMLSDG